MNNNNKEIQKFEYSSTRKGSSTQGSSTQGSSTQRSQIRKCFN